MFKAAASSYYIDLHLLEIKYLFADPELNPFNEKNLQVSGAEEAANFLRIKGRTMAKVRLNIFLPKGQIKPGLKRKTADAISRYCDFMISRNQRLLEIEQEAGMRAAKIGVLIFLAICLIVLSVIYFLGPQSEDLLGFFENFFTLFFWIAAWTVLDIFLYELYPYKLEIKVYKALKNAEVSIMEEI